jgi:hypothetical protein
MVQLPRHAQQVNGLGPFAAELVMDRAARAKLGVRLARCELQGLNRQSRLTLGDIQAIA